MDRQPKFVLPLLLLCLLGLVVALGLLANQSEMAQIKLEPSMQAGLQIDPGVAPLSRREVMGPISHLRESSSSTKDEAPTLGRLTAVFTDSMTGQPVRPFLEVYRNQEDGWPAFGGPSTVSLRPDPEGTIAIDLPAGSYSLIELNARAKEKRNSVSRMRPTMTNRRVLDSFEIRRDETTNRILFLNGGATLSGSFVQAEHPEKTTFWLHLIRETDAHLVGWTLVTADPRTEATNRMDEDGVVQPLQNGRFSFPGLEPGAYTLEVSLVRPGMEKLEPWRQSVLLPPEGLDLGEQSISIRSMLGLPPGMSAGGTPAQAETIQVRGKRIQTAGIKIPTGLTPEQQRDWLQGLQAKSISKDQD